MIRVDIAPPRGKTSSPWKTGCREQCTFQGFFEASIMDSPMVRILVISKKLKNSYEIEESF